MKLIIILIIAGLFLTGCNKPNLKNNQEFNITLDSTNKEVQYLEGYVLKEYYSWHGKVYIKQNNESFNIILTSKFNELDTLFKKPFTIDTLKKIAAHHSHEDSLPRNLNDYTITNLYFKVDRGNTYYFEATSKNDSNHILSSQVTILPFDKQEQKPRVWFRKQPYIIERDNHRLIKETRMNLEGKPIIFYERISNQ